MRTARIERNTKETRIALDLDLDGKGLGHVRTRIPFFDHMLDLTARHGLLDLSLTASGDIEVDSHHTVEDVGIVLGQAVKQALGERRGIVRYGWAVVPMDEARASAAIDLGGRPFLVYSEAGVTGRARVREMEAPESGKKRVVPAEGMGGFSLELVPEFFQAFCNNAGANLHLSVEAGRNRHHIAEALFKAFARALAQAASLDPRVEGVPSTKGSLG